jgi:diaminohydroxyphosphoribosylaminopyrimidine deaminase / 5-amino-6-(5-phosphoribosylamino)uracil reductase
MDEVTEKVFFAAIEEAKKGLADVHHNPPVGCVILAADGRELARGYHKKFGGPHAEVDALHQIADVSQLSGATVIVTLEPCAHDGKTPSCAKRLATLPVRQVIYGLEDPNPLVSGKGQRILSDAGIECFKWSSSPRLHEALEDLAETFLFNHRQQRPFVALKGATTQDGHLVAKDGRWITGSESLNYVHELRAQYDAVLVGVNTILMDDPRLSIRRVGQAPRSNNVVVLDPKGRLLQRNAEALRRAAILKGRAPSQVTLVTVRDPERRPLDLGVDVLTLPLRGGQFDLHELLFRLYRDFDIRSVFVEGGGETFVAFLQQSAAQRVYHFEAPATVKGTGPLSPWSKQDLPFARMSQTTLGSDVLRSYRLAGW